MSDNDQSKKILDLELSEQHYGNFNFMTNWNYGADDKDYYSGYEDIFGTSSGSKETLSSYCDHEWVDVGFNHPKFVCKKCDKDKEGS